MAERSGLRRLSSLTPEVSALLARAMFPDPERIAEALAHYLDDPQRVVLAWEVRGKVVSAAGVQLDGPRAELLHIGTAANESGRGYGRKLVFALCSELGLSELHAETDENAAGFYRACGFSVRPIQTRWGQRYRCWLIQSTIHPAT